MMDWPTAGVIITAILGVAAPLVALLMRRPETERGGGFDARLAVVETRTTSIERKLDDFIVIERGNWKSLYRRLNLRGGNLTEGGEECA